MNKIVIILMSTFLLSYPDLDYGNDNIKQLALDQTIDPDRYIVGPGDTFSFSMVTSSKVINQNIQVSPTGEIVIPLIGKIRVDKMVLSEVLESIERKCKSKISDSSVDITLIYMKDFKVLVTGSSNIPTGYRLVKSSTRLLDLFSEIDGQFKKDSLSSLHISSRDIVIKKNDDKTTYSYDLQKYKLNGIEENNPYLKPGDIIQLSYAKNYIDINGAVMVPGRYEYKQGDVLSDIIAFSGGLSNNINRIGDNVEILRHLNDLDKTIIHLSVDETSQSLFLLNPYDQILIKPNKDYKRAKTVTVSGEVLNPGIYSINRDSDIRSIIVRSGGYTNDADTSKIIINNEIIDKIGDKELNRILALNPEDRSDTDLSYIRARARSERGSFSNSNFNISNSIISDYKLFDKDIIYIPKQYSFIEVIGAVRNPGRYPFGDNINVQDYINQSGGITSNATKKYFIIQSDTGDRVYIKEIDSYKLKSQDIIFIEEKNDYNSWDRFKDFIEVGSQVLTILAILNGLGG